LPELNRLNPRVDKTFPVDKKLYTPNPPSRGIRRDLYFVLANGDGATIGEMYAAAYASGIAAWQTFDRWNGPGNIWNGIGMLRRHGDLVFTASTKKWRLILK
jgi:hypothetical protein